MPICALSVSETEEAREPVEARLSIVHTVGLLGAAIGILNGLCNSELAQLDHFAVATGQLKRRATEVRQPLEAVDRLPDPRQSTASGYHNRKGRVPLDSAGDARARRSEHRSHGIETEPSSKTTTSASAVVSIAFANIGLVSVSAIPYKTLPPSSNYLIEMFKDNLPHLARQTWGAVVFEFLHNIEFVRM